MDVSPPYDPDSFAGFHDANGYRGPLLDEYGREAFHAEELIYQLGGEQLRAIERLAEALDGNLDAIDDYIVSALDSDAPILALEALRKRVEGVIRLEQESIMHISRRPELQPFVGCGVDTHFFEPYARLVADRKDRLSRLEVLNSVRDKVIAARQFDSSADFLATLENPVEAHVEGRREEVTEVATELGPEPEPVDDAREVVCSTLSEAATKALFESEPPYDVVHYNAIVARLDGYVDLLKTLEPLIEKYHLCMSTIERHNRAVETLASLDSPGEALPNMLTRKGDARNSVRRAQNAREELAELFPALKQAVESFEKVLLPKGYFSELLQRLGKSPNHDAAFKQVRGDWNLKPVEDRVDAIRDVLREIGRLEEVPAVASPEEIPAHDTTDQNQPDSASTEHALSDNVREWTDEDFEGYLFALYRFHDALDDRKLRWEEVRSKRDCYRQLTKKAKENWFRRPNKATLSNAFDEYIWAIDEYLRALEDLNAAMIALEVLLLPPDQFTKSLAVVSDGEMMMKRIAHRMTEHNLEIGEMSVEAIESLTEAARDKIPKVSRKISLSMTRWERVKAQLQKGND